MKVIALILARDEDWILGFSLRAVFHWVDHVVILNHASTDRTADIIKEVSDENPGKITVLTEESREWQEMNQRQRMLEKARELGGTHFALIDADEALTASVALSIRDWIAKLEPAQILEVPWIACWRSLFKYRDDKSDWSRAQVTTAVRDAPELSWHPDKDGYQHHNRHPYGTRWTVLAPFPDKKSGGMLHFQFSSWRRLRAKQYWYRMMETVRWPGRKSPQELNAIYNKAMDEGELNLTTCPSEWWDFYGDLPSKISLEGAPWYEEEIKAYWEKYGPTTFHGLEIPNDLVGLDPRMAAEASIPKLWFCEDCAVVAVAAVPHQDARRSNQLLAEHHNKLSPGCHGKRLHLVVPGSLKEDRLIARFR